MVKLTETEVKELTDILSSTLKRCRLSSILIDDDSMTGYSHNNKVIVLSSAEIYKTYAMIKLARESYKMNLNRVDEFRDTSNCQLEQPDRPTDLKKFLFDDYYHLGMKLDGGGGEGEESDEFSSYDDTVSNSEEIDSEISSN